MKRVTFLMGADGIIEKVYTGINLNTHAEEILDEILKEKHFSEIGN